MSKIKPYGIILKIISRRKRSIHKRIYTVWGFFTKHSLKSRQNQRVRSQESGFFWGEEAVFEGRGKGL